MSRVFIPGTASMFSSALKGLRRCQKTHRYRREMMAAIADAARAGLFVASSRTDGLRAIRLFESINGVAFDPYDFWHRLKVSNMGWHFGLQRRLAQIQSKTA